MHHVSIGQALQHPNWKMGRKITIDSATMMNKGLEVIEAHHLFHVPVEQVQVVVHPHILVGPARTSNGIRPGAGNVR